MRSRTRPFRWHRSSFPRLIGAIAYKFILLRSDPHGGRVKIHSIQFQMHSIKALQMVSAWSKEHRLVLGQTKVSAKSNEITAIPALLEMLDLSSCIITIDAFAFTEIDC
ncbi:ISAs1 family transposase [Nostoc sp.]|uniref:ISAs1 family transposase n=1 Tax=Nostoc sp. TaxID=1180 RepID=UPI003FA54337